MVRAAWIGPMVGAAVLACLGSARANLVEEYFNGYGSADIDRLYGLNGGSGWSNAWGGSDNAIAPSYDAGTQMSFAFTGYSAAGNLSGSDDGRGLLLTGDNAGALSTRYFQTPMTGDVWAVAAVRHASNSGGDVLFWFDTSGSGGQANTFVGLRAGDDAVMRYSGAQATNSALNSALSNLLFVTRVRMNYSGALDGVDFWVKFEGSDVSNIGALGSPMLTNEGSDIFGATLNYIALSGGGQSGGIDVIRVADGPSAFTEVMTGVPEPSSLATLLLGAALLMRRRFAA